MSPKDFIDKIVVYYHDSRSLIINKGSHNIWRGVSHCISSKVEDLFSLFIADNIKNQSLEYVVDKTFSLCKECESIAFRPDLAIIQDNCVTHLFDIKMDMGYKRNVAKDKGFDKHNDLCESFRLSCNQVSYKDVDGKKRVLCVSKDIVYRVVVISESNMQKLFLDKIIQYVKTLKYVDIYFLTKDAHPNNYNGRYPNINLNEFNLLLGDVKKDVSSFRITSCIE